jgi:hypothetical protein
MISVGYAKAKVLAKAKELGAAECFCEYVSRVFFCADP